MERVKVSPTGFSPDNSNFKTTGSAFFYREDTADTVSLSDLMLYNDFPIIDIVQVENDIKPDKS